MGDFILKIVQVMILGLEEVVRMILKTSWFRGSFICKFGTKHCHEIGLREGYLLIGSLSAPHTR